MKKEGFRPVFFLESNDAFFIVKIWDPIMFIPSMIHHFEINLQCTDGTKVFLTLLILNYLYSIIFTSSWHDISMAWHGP